MSDAQLQETLALSGKKLLELSIAAAKRQVKNNQEIGQIKRKVARIKTVLAEKNFLKEQNEAN